MRRFELHRDIDVSGISGPGVVADGVVFDTADTFTFPDGATVALQPGWVRLIWRGEKQSVVLWPDLATAMAVHGHDGATRAVFTDGCQP